MELNWGTECGGLSIVFNKAESYFQGLLFKRDRITGGWQPKPETQKCQFDSYFFFFFNGENSNAKFRLVSKLCVVGVKPHTLGYLE